MELDKDTSINGTIEPNQECCIVALTGKINITANGENFDNLGTRQSVHEGIPTDSLYLPASTKYKITSTTVAKVALCYAPYCTETYGGTRPIKLISANEVGTELRGKGENVRKVNNILPDNVDYAHSLLVVEVITKSGNSSSYPPHRHDEDDLPNQSFLEETYYHEIHPPQGFVFQRVYTDDRSLDETMSVENENLVLVPKGYHPVAVPAGYSSFYINVMAGPTKVWKFYNDPDHEWIIKV
jgi:5-deoxy-glucuronate isomerase